MVNSENINIDTEKLLDILLSGAKSYRCGRYLYNLDPMRRQQIYQELETERLRRKYIDIREIHSFTHQDWNQTFLVCFLRYLSDQYNRANFAEIGFRVSYNTLLRERSSLRNIEAILIAASGLIDTLPRDSFTNSFRKDVEYMAHKYQITAVPQDRWIRRRMVAAKEPILRLVQVARLLHENDMIFNRLVKCKSRDDIFNLFNVEADSEWNRYFGDSKARRIGVEKCDMIGINFVVPMLYAFGHYSSDDEMTTRANDLNESLPAESNVYIKGWRKEGLTPTVAYETQALIQLYTVYCSRGECEKCHIYRHMLSKSSILSKLPTFLECK